MTEIALSEYDADEEPTRDAAEEREAFRIDDDAAAAWAMRKLAHYEKKRTENTKIAVQEMDRITEWLKRVNETLDGNAGYFRAILTEYAQRQRREFDRKTIDTPYGKVRSRSTQVKFTVTNEEEFVQWAERANADLLRVKVSPDLVKLKALVTAEETPTMGRVAVTESGEVVPGVTFEPGGVNFIVETE